MSLIKKRKVRGSSRIIEAVAPSKRAEVYYRTQIDNLIQSMLDQIIDAVRKPRLNDAGDSEVGDDEYINQLMKSLSDIAAQDITKEAQIVASMFAKRSEYQNKKNFINSFKKSIKVDISSVIEMHDLGDFLDDAIKKNINLIKSVKTDFINDIGAQVFEDFKKGVRQSDLVKNIYERGGVSKSRAEFIARDQNAKLNSVLNEARNTKLGIDIYRWKGWGGNRQRPSHKALNGMLCKYSDITVYSDDNGKTWKKRKSIGAYEGNPGTDYQCRCLDQPQFNF